MMKSIRPACRLYNGDVKCHSDVVSHLCADRCGTSRTVGPNGSLQTQLLSVDWLALQIEDLFWLVERSQLRCGRDCERKQGRGSIVKRRLGSGRGGGVVRDGGR